MTKVYKTFKTNSFASKQNSKIKSQKHFINNLKCFLFFDYPAFIHKLKAITTSSFVINNLENSKKPLPLYIFIYTTQKFLNYKTTKHENLQIITFNSKFK